MRQAGTINERQEAERFSSYLLTLGITSKVEPSADEWAIWIHNENDIPRSREELERYLTEPGNPRYQSAEHEAEIVRRQVAERNRQAQKNYVDMRNEWASPWRRRRVTVLMMAASIFLALADMPTAALRYSMPKVLEGQVWRLITPIFLHDEGNVLHLLFNMYWLFYLGSMIEWSLGWLRYAVLVLVIALVSNYGQYYWVDENFIGMSGVVYGLFGYAWIRSRLDPTCGLYVSSNVVLIMLAWLVICFTPVVGHIANAAHVGGLACGALFGAAQARFRRG